MLRSPFPFGWLFFFYRSVQFPTYLYRYAFAFYLFILPVCLIGSLVPLRVRLPFGLRCFLPFLAFTPLHRRLPPPRFPSSPHFTFTAVLCQFVSVGFPRARVVAFTCHRAFIVGLFTLLRWLVSSRSVGSPRFTGSPCIPHRMYFPTRLAAHLLTL